MTPKLRKSEIQDRDRCTWIPVSPPPWTWLLKGLSDSMIPSGAWIPPGGAGRTWLCLWHLSFLLASSASIALGSLYTLLIGETHFFRAGLHLFFSAPLSECLNILSERKPLSSRPLLFGSVSTDTTNSSNYFPVLF